MIVGIQARVNSTRLPGKVMADIGGKPMIRRVWDACEAAYWERIILTSKETTDDPLVDYLEAAGMKFRRGSLDNVLSRYIDVAKKLKPSILVRVCADAPFIQKRWIYRAIEEIEKTDYPAFVPGALHAGTPEHWLECAEETDDDDREHAGAAWFELYGHHVKCVPSDYLMVNTPEDLEEARRRWTLAHPGT